MSWLLGGGVENTFSSAPPRGPPLPLLSDQERSKAVRVTVGPQGAGKVRPQRPLCALDVKCSSLVSFSEFQCVCVWGGDREVFSLWPSHCVCMGSLTLRQVGHQGRAPAHSHTHHQSRDSPLISPRPTIHCPVSSQFPLQISYPLFVPAHTCQRNVPEEPPG